MILSDAIIRCSLHSPDHCFFYIHRKAQESSWGETLTRVNYEALHTRLSQLSQSIKAKLSARWAVAHFFSSHSTCMKFENFFCTKFASKLLWLWLYFFDVHKNSAPLRNPKNFFTFALHRYRFYVFPRQKSRSNWSKTEKRVERNSHISRSLWKRVLASLLVLFFSFFSLPHSQLLQLCNWYLFFASTRKKPHPSREPNAVWLAQLKVFK